MTRRYFDPELTAEAKMNRMREEMDTLRWIIISLIPEPYQSVINPPYEFTREESKMWLSKTAWAIINLTTPERDIAPCPLCGAVANVFFGGRGFKYPDGLHRHLTGSHNAAHCRVMYAADGVRRVWHRKQFPGDYGPYGCD